MHEERIDQRRIVFGPLEEALRAIAPAEPIGLVGTRRSVALIPPGAVTVTTVYDDVRPHNPRTGIDAVARLVDEQQIETLVAIGSSSAIDLGKAVSDGRALTLVVIPTALGGAEMSRGYGFLAGDVKGGGRLKTPPPVVIYDATLLASLQQRELGSIGINAWAHCIEAAYARTEHATGLAAAVFAGGRLPALLRAAAKVRDWTLDGALFQAAHLAGYALDTRSMGLHHAICHVIGGLTQIPHGIVNAIVLPHAVRGNARLDPNVVEAVADWFGIADLAGEAEAIARAFALPRTFAELGAPADLIERALPRVMASPLLANNAAPVDEATVRTVLTAAYG
ncbi:MAG TPA: iron-containing alcohol dehydrogenase [Candidatus Sulfotelmatobacter sp.]|nr:iron-containing alcohol dehydrogenase [Candidatus Sulfotelmatobacter sp.]